ncbi:conserved hypothetical protein, secreted [Candidatus Magnetomorum sp. HK-1]|nr:conserved hypothetical protein, secreted [Candidatus Magnetomorum sp. HK-1]
MKKYKLIKILVILLFLVLPVIVMASEINSLPDNLFQISNQEMLEDTSISIQFSITENSETNPITKNSETNPITENSETNPITENSETNSITTTENSETNPITITEDSQVNSITTVENSQMNSITVRIISDQPDIIPNDEQHIQLTNKEMSYTLTITPLTNAYGGAWITILATDHNEISLTHSFQLHVLPVNDPPNFIKSTDSISINEDSELFEVNDFAKILNTGPENESEQILSINVTTDREDLFSTQPYLSPFGLFRFASAPDLFGEATVYFTILDNGGHENGGENYITDQLLITINPINDPPLFQKGEDIIVKEDSGPFASVNWAKNISCGPNETDQSCIFYLSSSNKYLFASMPNLTPGGRLSFIPAPDKFGKTQVDVILREYGATQNASETVSFTITVEQVNDQPSFIKGNDLKVQSDAGLVTINNWVNNINPGNEETGQKVYFECDVDLKELFTKLPQVDEFGTLTFMPNPVATGIANISIWAIDDGGTINGGIDTSLKQEFSITIDYSPQVSFEPGDDISVLEDSEEKFISNWIRNITPQLNDNIDEIYFKTDCSQSDFFTITPQISPDGTLVFQPEKNISGTVQISITMVVILNNSRILTSDLKTSYITIIHVNDCPSFTVGNDQEISNVSGMQILTEWAKDINAGVLEPFQEFMFNVTCDNPELFLDEPKIDKNGTLRYSPAFGQYGISVVHVYLIDDGGFTNNGCNMSDTYDFSISILPHKSLSVIVEGQGQVRVNDIWEINDQWTQNFSFSETVHLSSEESPDWIFSHWSGDISDISPEMEIVMSDSKTITAHFMPLSATVNLEIQGKGWVKIDNSILQLPVKKLVNTADWINITALPEDLFLSWAGNYEGYTNPVNIQMNENFYMEAQFINTKTWQMDMWLEKEGVENSEQTKTIIGISNQKYQEFYYASGQYECSIYSMDPDNFDNFSHNIISIDDSEKKYQWILAVNPKGSIGDPLTESTVTVRWQPYKLSLSGIYTISKGFGNDQDIIVSDMRKISSFEINGVNSDQYFTITWIPFNAFHTFEMVSGWNLISIPLIPENNKLSELFPDADVAYGYKNGQYYSTQVLEPGIGYWVNMKRYATYKVYGDIFNFSPKNFETGWHLIGSLKNIAETVSEKDAINVMYYYQHGAYTMSDIIEPGLGYWIKMTQSDLINIMIQ